jgi:formiminotetrahydrofolate cyclodeaminase
MLAGIGLGRVMAAAAVQGALENLTITLESITDADSAAKMKSEARLLRSRIAKQPVGAEKS